MKTLPIANTSLKFSALALGTGPFGTGVSLERTEELYSLYRESGGNTIDTAHCYCFWVPGQGAGSSERAVGHCVRKIKDEGKVNIVTKGAHPSVPPDYVRPDDFLSSKVIASDIAESLERLGGVKIDLYLLHRDDGTTPVSQIIDTLNSHVNSGHIRSFGASNWTTRRMAEANDYAKKHKLHGFVMSQPQFSLAKTNGVEPVTDPNNRYLYDHDFVWHSQSKLPVLCYSPTAGGYFATRGEKSKESFDNQTSRARLARAEELAAKMKVSANQIALAWLMHLPFPVVPILGTADPAHLVDCLASAKIKLSKKEVEWLGS
jgi:aryl-alcohol dehydrogenase-like predicted oxidoreductase